MKRDFKLSIDSLDGTISSIRDLNSKRTIRRPPLFYILSLYIHTNILLTFCTRLQRFCGIQKENGLGFLR